MERLTYYDDGKWRLRIGETEHSGPQVDRIAELENILEGCDLIRIQELVEADKEGRCGVPPVKLHQRIYRAFCGKVLEETVCSAIWEPFAPRPRWKIWVMGSGLPYYWDDCIGKTVFLTREAAEAVLKGEQNESV